MSFKRLQALYNEEIIVGAHNPGNKAFLSRTIEQCCRDKGQMCNIVATVYNKIDYCTCMSLHKLAATMVAQSRNPTYNCYAIVGTTCHGYGFHRYRCKLALPVCNKFSHITDDFQSTLTDYKMLCHFLRDLLQNQSPS